MGISILLLRLQLKGIS